MTGSTPLPSCRATSCLESNYNSQKTFECRSGSESENKLFKAACSSGNTPHVSFPCGKRRGAPKLPSGAGLEKEGALGLVEQRGCPKEEAEEKAATRGLRFKESPMRPANVSLAPPAAPAAATLATASRLRTAFSGGLLSTPIALSYIPI